MSSLAVNAKEFVLPAPWLSIPSSLFAMNRFLPGCFGTGASAESLKELQDEFNLTYILFPRLECGEIYERSHLGDEQWSNCSRTS